MRTLSIFNMFHTAHHGVLNNFFNLWANFISKYIFPLLLLNIVSKLLLEKHVALNVRVTEILMIGTDRIVSQMDEFIMYILCIIVFS